jgi:hypothetical protein
MTESDISKALSALGWEISVSPKGGLISIGFDDGESVFISKKSLKAAICRFAVYDLHTQGMEYLQEKEQKNQ